MVRPASKILSPDMPSQNVSLLSSEIKS